MPLKAKTLSIKEIERKKRDYLEQGRKPVFSVGGVSGLTCDYTGDRPLYFLRFQWKEKGDTIFFSQSLSLAEVRKLGAEYRVKIAGGINPKLEKREKQEAEREAERKRLEAEKAKALTFQKVFFQWMDKVEGTRYQKRTDKLRAQKEEIRRIEIHVFPFIADTPISEVAPEQLAEVFNPLYLRFTDTGKKALKTVREVFRYARGQKLIKNDPLDETFELLTDEARRSRPGKKPRPALPFKQIPSLVKALLEENTAISLLGVLVILTAVRFQVAQLAEWSQIDFCSKTWLFTEKQDKNKGSADNGGIDRVVYLSSMAIELLRRLPPYSERYLFVSGRGLFDRSDMSHLLEKLHQKKKEKDGAGWIDPNELDENGNPRKITIHGTARSGFRTWAQDDELGNLDRFNPDSIEMCLSHKVTAGDKYGGAYNRAKHEKARRLIMEAWGMYCLQGISLADYLPTIYRG